MRQESSRSASRRGFARTIILHALGLSLALAAGPDPTAALAFQSIETPSRSPRATVAVWRQDENGIQVISADAKHPSEPLSTSLGPSAAPGRKYTPVPGDYDGDGFLDIAACLDAAPPTYPTLEWIIIRSSDNVRVVEEYGEVDDVPSPGDFGAGHTQIAVYRPSQNRWYVSQSGSSNEASEAFGEPGETILPNANYGGQSTLDRASWNPDTGVWRIRYDGNASDTLEEFGAPGDVPVPADYDGDGYTDRAVFRPSDGSWWIASGSTGAVTTLSWGQTGDTAVPADFDGDGKADPCVFRIVDGDGWWWILNSKTGEISATQLGRAGDIPVPGTYLAQP